VRGRVLLTVRCSECGHAFETDEAMSSVFDGAGGALYLCPECGAWAKGPPPG
jgi:NAD-dependent SIR2 family protein deacetylase